MLAVESFTQALQTQDTLWIAFYMLLLSWASLLFLGRYLGKIGLYLYASIGIIIANLQVMKATTFFFYPEPIALGSIVFTSLFACADLLNEYYGQKAAETSVKLGFLSYLLLTLFMLLTLGYKPVESDTLMTTSHHSLTLLFTPAPAIFAASLIAYFISQKVDIYTFRFIRKWTSQKYLWLRTSLSTMLSIAVDNTIFSLLAWYVFASQPYDLTTIFHTYILGIFLFRFVISLFFIPLMYIGKKFMRKSL